MAALDAYVDFGSISTEPSRDKPLAGGLPRKGMLIQDVENLLGRPANSSDRKEGSLKVQTREYRTPDGRVTAEFVEGVLIRYRVTSE
jgi:hypothetical protein